MFHEASDEHFIIAPNQFFLSINGQKAQWFANYNANDSNWASKFLKDQNQGKINGLNHVKN